MCSGSAGCCHGIESELRPKDCFILSRVSFPCMNPKRIQSESEVSVYENEKLFVATNNSLSSSLFPGNLKGRNISTCFHSSIQNWNDFESEVNTKPTHFLSLLHFVAGAG